MAVLGERALNRAVLARQHLLERAQLPLPRLLEDIAGIQARMRETLAALAPEWAAGVVQEMTASPRTTRTRRGHPGVRQLSMRRPVRWSIPMISSRAPFIAWISSSILRWSAASCRFC